MSTKLRKLEYPKKESEYGVKELFIESLNITPAQNMEHFEYVDELIKKVEKSNEILILSKQDIEWIKTSLDNIVTKAKPLPWFRKIVKAASEAISTAEEFDPADEQ